MSVDYEHARNLHTVDGPQIALPLLLGDLRPQGILDVGCGTGTWLSAALQMGIRENLGIDGVEAPAADFKIPRELFRLMDLNQPWELNRRFDLALCLEVAEHLPESSAPLLIRSICHHSDIVLFSAACPGQIGQNHLNCQWPAYWQIHFNQAGFTCSDEPRWRIWDNSGIEPWYRQNLFVARRDPQNAGKEARIRSVVHPACLNHLHTDWQHRIESGGMPMRWYATLLLSSFGAKLFRKRRSVPARS